MFWRLYHQGHEGVALQDDSGIKRHFGMDIASQSESKDMTEYHDQLISRDLIAGLISMDILYQFQKIKFAIQYK